MKKILLITISVLLLISSASCGAAGSEESFTLSFITIGKGDAFILSCPEGQHYMVDTGKREDYPKIARYLRQKDISSLDGIFLSHGHRDHAGGLDYILSAFPTKAVYVSAADNESYVYIDPEAICQRHETRLIRLSGGECMDLGGVECSIWIPEEADSENQNNNSVIMLLTHGEKRFLLMGDAELEEEAEFMADFNNLSADVLKLGHHGETDASSEAFLDAVDPSIALIAGNEEENPDSVNPIIASRLSKRGIEAYYSDADIPGWEIVSDGERISCSPLKEKTLSAEKGLEITDIDTRQQRLTIKNSSGVTKELGGFMLFAKHGDCAYFFPSGTSLAPGGELSVVCKGHELDGALVWDEENVWSKKHSKARLYDSDMNLISEYS